jgi:tetratricopeptide (TPR) repeat protein
MARQQMGFVSESEGIPKAKEAALRAVALDENSAEAHTALAAVMTWGEWDWAGAQAEWTRALELNPNDDNAHAYYAHYLAHRGRAAEGLRHSDLAVKLDPMNALNHALRAIVLLYLQRFDDAMTAARTAISLRADLSISYVAMMRACMAKGMRDELLAEQRLRISRDPERVAAFEQGLAEGGYEGAQRAIADVLAARYEKVQDSSTSLFGIALRYLDAGENDRAIVWLQKAYDVHDSDLPYINAPPWDRLRNDPRYQALLRRIGLSLYEKE